MSKHTPGPWVPCAPEHVVSQTHEGLIEGSRTIVCRVGNLRDLRLIAAAPEMLKALEWLFDEYDDRRAQFGSDPLWKKWEDVDAVEEARRLLDELKGETE